jgi:hypothetical protein
MNCVHGGFRKLRTSCVTGYPAMESLIAKTYYSNTLENIQVYYDLESVLLFRMDQRKKVIFIQALPNM